MASDAGTHDLSGLDIPDHLRPMVEGELKNDRDEFPVYPENWKSVLVFLAMQTQWLESGMNYASLPYVMRRRGVTRKEEDGVFDDVRVMELEALEEKKKRRTE